MLEEEEFPLESSYSYFYAVVQALQGVLPALFNIPYLLLVGLVYPEPARWDPDFQACGRAHSHSSPKVSCTLLHTWNCAGTGREEFFFLLKQVREYKNGSICIKSENFRKTKPLLTLRGRRRKVTVTHK